MKKIAVTGANGYIGRNFVKYLLEKDLEIFCLVRKPLFPTFNKADKIHELICPMEQYSDIEKSLADKDIDTFYHFAWKGSSGELRSNYAVQLENCKYTCDAAMLAKKIGCKRFVTTGTITENVARQILENQYSAQNLIYGLSKLYAHSMLDVVCRNIGLEYVWVQLSNIYGGDNTTNNLISYTLNEWQNNRVPMFGSGEQPYNFTHIDDVVEALYLIGAEEKVDKEYVISDGDVRKLKEFLQELSNIYRKPVGIGERKDDGIEYKKEWFLSDGLNKLGFKPKSNFANRIKTMNENHVKDEIRIVQKN